MTSRPEDASAGRGPSHDAVPAGPLAALNHQLERLLDWVTLNGEIPSDPICWLCDQPISDPPEIIGQYRATTIRVAHRRCLRTLDELDLDLPPA